MISKCKITGKKLVIQLGRTQTRVALINGGNILHSKIYDTPAGVVEDGAIRNQESVRELLKSITKEPEFKGVKQAVFVMSTSQVITEMVTVPDVPASRLEKLLHANVDMYFPVDMHDYQLAWQVVGPKPNENGHKEVIVQLWAMPVTMLNRYYQVANACGLSVVAIDYIGNSIAGAIGATFTSSKDKKKPDLNTSITLSKKKAEPAPAEDKHAQTGMNPDTQLHLLLEQDILGMTFVQNGQIMVQRFIRCGSDPAYQFGELAMMLEYFRAMDIGRGSNVIGFASGSLAEDPALVIELEQNLGIPVDKFPAPYDLGWFLCVGAGNTTMDFGIPSLNKPSRVRLEFQRQLWQYGILLTGILAVLFVVLALLTARLGWSSNITALKNTQQMLTIQNSKVADYAENYQEYKAQYDAYNADWENIFATLRFPNNNLVLIMEELEALIPQQASVTNMQIDQSGLNITFACDSKEVAAYLISELDEMKYATLQRPVSDLYGGGGGPAESYGSDKKKESAPKEGSASSYGPNAVQEAFLREASHLSEEQFIALRDTYGKTPSTSSNSMATSDAQKRADAIGEMFSTNPYAALVYRDLLLEDYGQNTNILATYITRDIALLGLDVPSDYDGAQAYLAQLLAILTRDDVLEKTEALLLNNEVLCDAAECSDDENCNHKYIGNTYLHYLEVQAGTRTEEDFPYLDVDRIESDVQNGGAKTGDDTINALLKKQFYKEPAPTEPPATEPSTPDVTLPTEPTPDVTQPTEPTPDVTQPTEPNPDVTQPTEPKPDVTQPTEPKPDVTQPTEPKPGETEPEDNKLEMLIKLLGAFEGYWKTGKVESSDFSDKENIALKFLFETYLKDGNFDSLKNLSIIPEDIKSKLFGEEYKTYIAYIDSYFQKMLNTSLSNYIRNGLDEKDESSKLMDEYFTNDGKLKESHTFVQLQIDNQLRTHQVTAALKDRIASSRKNPLSNFILDKRISLFEKSGYTESGIEALNTALGTAFSLWHSEQLNKQTQQAAAQGAAASPRDTHIYFSARLVYKEEFLEAERSWKGLDISKKIQERFTKEVGE